MRASQEAKDAESFDKYNVLGRDIAKVLRHNIVQAEKREVAGETDIYHVHMRAETELGDNDTVKNPSPSSSKGPRVKCCSA